MSVHTDISNIISDIRGVDEYITNLEATITGLETELAATQAELDELKSQLFVDGVTTPAFDPGSETGNVGAKGLLTRYTGTITNGVIKLSDGKLYQNVLFPGVVDITNGEQLHNCRVEVPADYLAADSIKACVRILNGSGNTGAQLYDVTVINRAQRVMNGVMGRNTEIRRSVVLGCVDGFSDSTTGSAPQNFGLKIHDSIVPEHAFWQAPSAPSEIHGSDTVGHVDGFQHGVTLQSEIVNTTIDMYVSDRIGTGTPGSARDQGNRYVPSGGANYIVDAATMASYRSASTKLTTPSQSQGGVAHRVQTKGSGSCVMVNRDNLIVAHCHFAGSIIPVNLLDANLPTSMNVTVTDSGFYNDMVNGPGSRATDPAVKGYAIIVKRGKTFRYSGNTWSDGTAVLPTAA
jgi:hypothetical protein